VGRVPGVPETVLVAPDSFKGTFSATEVATAIGRGLQDAGRPVDLCPVADGGEGTLDALGAGLGAERLTAPATDPLGRPIDAEFGLAGEVAVVDTAAASGLGLVAEDERDAFAASTAGTGELIAAAVQAGARVVYLGVGGSATTDGGAGAITAIERAGGLGALRRAHRI
jgi:glycerate kinase